jgi:hypothetical protein
MPKHNVSSKPYAKRQRANDLAAGILSGKTNDQALRDVGYSPGTIRNQRPLKSRIYKGTIKNALDNAPAGGGLDDCANRIAELMHSENGHVALGATELNLKARNLLNSKLDVDVKGPISVTVKEFVLKSSKKEPETKP